MSVSLRGRDALVETIASGMAARYARALKAQDRLDSLDGRTGALATEELRDPETARALAGELIAELLRVATDARLLPLLETVVATPGPARTVAARLGITRLALLRRVGELVSVGLAERDPESDVVRGTALGESVVTLLGQLADAAAAAFVEGGV